MPYIHHTERGLINDEVAALTKAINENFRPEELDGVINYAFTRLLLSTIAKGGPRYTKVARAMGALACVQAEFYRKYASPYEDEKALANGEVF